MISTINWIKCSERLPKENEEVLLLNKDGNITTGYFCFIGRNNNIKEWSLDPDIATGDEWEFNFADKFDDVLYWAEKPVFIFDKKIED